MPPLTVAFLKGLIACVVAQPQHPGGRTDMRWGDSALINGFKTFILSIARGSGFGLTIAKLLRNEDNVKLHYLTDYSMTLFFYFPYSSIISPHFILNVHFFHFRYFYGSILQN